MNWLDILIIGLLFLGLLQGSRQGFIRQLATLGSVLLAISCYGLFAPAVGAFAVDHLHIDPKITGTVGFLGAFAVIAFGARALGNILNRVINKTPLGLVNRLGGAIVGVFVTALFIGIIGLCIDFLFPIHKPTPETASTVATSSHQSVREESALYQSLEEMIPTILPFKLFRK